jgi:hypothetical protein
MYCMYACTDVCVCVCVCVEWVDSISPSLQLDFSATLQLNSTSIQFNATVPPLNP